MELTLIQASRAAGVFNSLGNQVLPGRVAKVIYDNRKMLMHHVEFLAEEEQKLIRLYNAESENGMAYHVADDEEKNKEFITKISDLQQIKIDIAPVLINEDMLLSVAHLTPNDIGFIDYIFEIPEERSEEE